MKEKIPPLKLPIGLELYPFQVETVKKTLIFMENLPSKAAYVASEMGLGKSITACVTANSLGAAKVLVVCPAIMRLVWEEEIGKWCRFSVNSIPLIKTILNSEDINEAKNASWVVCSYALASKTEVLEKLLKIDFDLLIIDEAHYIKNRGSLRSRAIIKTLWPKIPRRLLLSGTPFTRNIIDCYVPFHAILPSEFPSFNDFASNYSYIRFSQWGTDFYGLKNPEKLSKIIRDNFYIRYKKEQVLTELPPKIYQRILLPESYSLKVKAKERENLIRDTQAIFEALNKDKGIMLPPSIAAHRRMQGELKAPAVAEFAENLLEQGLPIVIFAEHKNVIAYLRDHFKDYKPSVITGDTPAEDRMREVKLFQEGETLLFIGNFMAAGVGITLTRSSHVLLAELSYIPATINQAIDRLHRITQKDQVTVYYFIVENSLDKSIDSILIQRVREFNKVLDAPTGEAHA